MENAKFHFASLKVCKHTQHQSDLKFKYNQRAKKGEKEKGEKEAEGKKAQHLGVSAECVRELKSRKAMAKALFRHEIDTHRRRHSPE
jgi:hypothetical protein